MEIDSFKKLTEVKQWNYIQYLQNRGISRTASIHNISNLKITMFTLFFMLIGFASIIGTGIEAIGLISMAVFCLLILGFIILQPKIKKMISIENWRDKKLKILTKYYFEQK